MQTPIQHFLNAPNLAGGGTHRISFLDWGDPTSDQVVVCVHGLTRNAHDFDALARSLSGSCRVIAIDMAGRGDSDRLADPSHYHYATYVADALAVLDNFHLRSVDWVGTSLGGIVGMMIAAFHPWRIRRLVLNDIGAFIPAEGLRRIVDYVSSTPASFATITDAQNRLRQTFASFGVQGEDQWAHLFQYSIRPLPDGNFGLAFDPDILVPMRQETKDFTEVKDVDMSSLWEKVICPTLVIRGTESDILTENTLQLMRTQNLKCQSVEFAGIGHAPMLMSAEQISPVAEFLSGGAAGVMRRAL